MYASGVAEVKTGEASFSPILDSLRSFVRQLEPGSYASSDVPVMLKRIAEAEKLCGTAKLLMSKRAKELSTQQGRGEASPSNFIADEFGQSVGRTRRDLDTARRLVDQPDLEAALRAGEISTEQAALIAPAIEADPDSSRQLLDVARTGSFRDLRSECDSVIAASLTEEEATAREARLREGRHLRIGTTAGGAVYFRGELPPVEGAAVKNAIEAEAKRVFLEASREGRREAPEAYAADALVRLCRSGGRAGEGPATPSDSRRRDDRGGTPRTEIVLHVSAEALRRGQLAHGEQCEIEGVGPVCLSTVEYLFGNAWAKLLIHEGVDILSVTHLHRYIPAHIDTALRARDRVCAVPRCGISYGLERDHIIPVEDGGPTELDNLVRLCKRHHYLKTHKYWRLLGRPGAWQWVNIRLEQATVAPGDLCDLAPPFAPTVGLARPIFPLPPLEQEPDMASAPSGRPGATRIACERGSESEGDGADAARGADAGAGGRTSHEPDGSEGIHFVQQTFACGSQAAAVVKLPRRDAPRRPDRRLPELSRAGT